MIRTPILTLQQSTFGSRASLWKALYVKKKQWLSSVSQHHAAICWSNVTQNPISHSTVVNRIEVSLSLFLCLPGSVFPSLAFALNCFQACFSLSLVSLSFSPSLSLAFKHVLILKLILFLPVQPSLFSLRLSVLLPLPFLSPLLPSLSWVHCKPAKSKNVVYMCKQYAFMTAYLPFIEVSIYTQTIRKQLNVFFKKQFVCQSLALMFLSPWTYFCWCYHVQRVQYDLNQ